MEEKRLPKSCIECEIADCTGYCKILNDRQEDYALKRIMTVHWRIKMAKRDKFYEARICGYIAAFQKAKNEGLDALERDIKMRGILKIDLNIPEEKMREYFDELSQNLYNNTMTAVAWTLHHIYGFGKKRLKEFKENFDKTVQYTIDLDYLGRLSENSVKS